MKILFFCGLIVIWSLGTVANDSTSSLRSKRDAEKDAEKAGKGALVISYVAATFGTAYNLRNVLTVGTQFLEKFGPALAIMAPAFFAVGSAFAFIAMFIPTDPSPELIAIRDGFEKMNGRFDQLSSQIEQLAAKVDYNEAVAPYKEVRNNLEIVYSDYMRVIQYPNITQFRTKFLDACKDPEIEPSQALVKLHRIIVKPTWDDSIHLAEAIIDHFSLDYTVVMNIFDTITSEAYTLAQMDSACYGLISNDSGLQILADSNAQLINEIIQSFAAFEKKMADIDPIFRETLIQDLEDVLKVGKSDTQAEQSLTDECAQIKLTATDKASQVCNGDDSIKTQTVAIRNHLKNKYPWLQWLTLVYTGGAGGAIDCIGDTNHSVNANFNKYSVFAVWARPNLLPALENNIRNASTLLQQAIPSEVQWFTQCIPGRLSGLDKKSQIIVKEKMVQKDKGLFCTLGGNGDYHRSIITSGIGAFRSYYCIKPSLLSIVPNILLSDYTVDYVITYYAQ